MRWNKVNTCDKCLFLLTDMAGNDWWYCPVNGPGETVLKVTGPEAGDYVSFSGFVLNSSHRLNDPTEHFTPAMLAMALGRRIWAAANEGKAQFWKVAPHDKGTGR